MRTCRPTVGSAPSRLVTSPSTTDQMHLPGPRSGLVGHHSWSRPTSPTAIQKSPERSHWLSYMPVLPDLNTSPIPRSVLPILLNSSSFTGSEKREDHVPHVIFFEDTLFTPRVIRAPMRLYDRYCRLKTGSPGNLASTLPQRDTVDSRRTRFS